jgi:MFS family permease
MTDVSPAPPAGLRTVLRAPQVALVLTASQVGRLPLGATPLALLLFGRQSVSLAVTGALVAVFTAGLAAGTPLLARAVDRRRQVPVLAGSTLLSSVGYLLTALSGGHLALLLAGAALAGFGTPPMEACLRALWPDLVPASAQSAAYALDIALQEVIFVAGPLVTLGAVAWGGPAAGLYVAGALQLGGVAAFTTAAAVREWRSRSTAHHWAGPLRTPRLLLLLLGVIGVGAAIGGIPVALTAYAEAAGNRSLTGWLLAAQSLGALIGGLLYTRAGPGHRRRLPLLAAALAAGFLPLLLTPAPAPMAVLLALSGLALPPLLTCVFLTTDRLAPPGTAVEAFAWVATAFTIGSATGAALVGASAGALNSALDGAGSRVGFAFAPAAALLAVAAMVAAQPHSPAIE